jgi:hypothetical protein
MHSHADSESSHAVQQVSSYMGDTWLAPCSSESSARKCTAGGRDPHEDLHDRHPRWHGFQRWVFASFGTAPNASGR